MEFETSKQYLIKELWRNLIALSPFVLCLLLVTSCLTQAFGSTTKGQVMKDYEAKAESEAVMFAAHAENDVQLLHTYILAESLREFGGRYSEAPIWVFIPEDLNPSDSGLLKKFSDIGVTIKKSRTPKEAGRFYYAGKVFAASAAEEAAIGKARILVWLDEDTVFLGEPSEIELPDGIAFGYRPVMHNRSGSLFSEPPDSFWARIYEVLSVDEKSLMPMKTPADHQVIRAYFNAGMIVVRPERGILRKWAIDFESLCNDDELVDMCMSDVTKRIFLHQTALVGAAVNSVGKDEMIELSDAYNYPMFFKYNWGGDEEFDSLENVVTLRYDIYFNDPDPEWASKLKASDEIINWLKARLGKE